MQCTGLKIKFLRPAMKNSSEQTLSTPADLHFAPLSLNSILSFLLVFPFHYLLTYTHGSSRFTSLSLSHPCSVVHGQYLPILLYDTHFPSVSLCWTSGQLRAEGSYIHVKRDHPEEPCSVLELHFCQSSSSFFSVKKVKRK